MNYSTLYNFSRVVFSIALLFLSSQEGFSNSGATVSGKLLKSGGKPMPYKEIELVPLEANKIVNDSRLLAFSHAAGNFTFKNVPKGEYTLSINFDNKPSEFSPYPTFFYPNALKREEAQIFVLDERSRIVNLIFRMPPELELINVTGKVVNFINQPIAGVYVSLHDTDFDDSFMFAFSTKTDKNGNFSLRGFRSRTYQVRAIHFEKPIDPFEPPPKILGAAKTQIFLLDSKPQALTLIVRTPGDEELTEEVY